MVDGFSCILDFPKFSGGGPPNTPYKGNTSIKPSKPFFNKNSSQRQRKKLESPPPFKQSTRNLSLGHTEIEKRRRALGQDLFVSFVIGLFETSICPVAEDKVCDSCIVSSWALLIFLLRLWWPNLNLLYCVITQNGESSCDLLLSVANRKALAPGGGEGRWGVSRLLWERIFKLCIHLESGRVYCGKETQDAEINFCLLFAFFLFSISHSNVIHREICVKDFSGGGGGVGGRGAGGCFSASMRASLQTLYTPWEWPSILWERNSRCWD